MNRFRLKYRQFFTALLLLSAYLVGNFSLPVIEGVHFIMHLGDDTTLHSFQSHDGQHQHQLLTNIDELLNSSTDTDFPTENTNQNKLKKIVQQLVVTPSLNAWFAVTNQTNYSYQPFGFPTPFLPINNPPPEI